jgi:hypothetical protein
MLLLDRHGKMRKKVTYAFIAKRYKKDKVHFNILFSILFFNI